MAGIKYANFGALRRWDSYCLHVARIKNWEVRHEKRKQARKLSYVLHLKRNVSSLSVNVKRFSIFHLAAFVCVDEILVWIGYGLH